MKPVYLVLLLVLTTYVVFEFIAEWVPALLTIRDHGWPCFGIAFALVLLIFIDQKDIPPWIPLILYLIHQFEEHGIDLLGRRYAFQASLCSVLSPGLPISQCPATMMSIFMVNVVAVWGACALAALERSRSRSLFAITVGIHSVNALVHLVAGVQGKTVYNPGLASACAFFIPYSLWIYRRTPVATILLSVFSGVLTHLILMFGGFGLIKMGFERLGDLVQGLNGFTPFLIFLAGRSFGILDDTPRAAGGSR